MNHLPLICVFVLSQFIYNNPVLTKVFPDHHTEYERVRLVFTDQYMSNTCSQIHCNYINSKYITMYLWLYVEGKAQSNNNNSL